MSGGITFEGLYGGAPDPAEQLVREGSAARRLVVPLNTTPPAPFALDFAARTVLVDNPSGAWYRVNERWLPPWTIGAVLLLDVPDTNLEVTAGPPAGHFTVLAGEPLLLIALEAPLAPHPGLAVAPHRSLVVSTAWIGGWSSASVAFVGIQTGTTRVMVDAVTIAAAPEGGGVTDPYGAVRDQMPVVVWARSAGLGDTEVLAQLAISPDQPAMRVDFEPGAIITELLRGVNIEAAQLALAGKSRVRATLEYRLVVTA